MRVAWRATLRPHWAIDSNPPIELGAHALATLEYIRGSLETAGSFAVPGLAGISMGAIGLVAAVSASFAPDSTHELAIWLAAAVLAFVGGSALMVRQAARAGTTLYRGPARRFVLCLAPSLVAGTLLTAVLWRAAMAPLLSGTWLLLYGCGVVSASTTTARCVGVMGATFVALGAAAFVLPPLWHNALLGAGFGGLHIGFGLYLRIRQSCKRQHAS
jgi:hypothetical protein